MTALEKFTYMICNHDNSMKLTDSKYNFWYFYLILVGNYVPFFTPEMAKNLCCLLVQNAMEKIDRTREKAGSIFERIVFSKEPVVPFVPHHDDVIKLIPR